MPLDGDHVAVAGEVALAGADELRNMVVVSAGGFSPGLGQDDEDVPEGVAINEAVELAKKFGPDESAGFVNGILAKIIKKAE